MATNTLGVYSPIFYAQQALRQLEEVMGMANRVHRGFDEERRSFNRGDTISIRRPSTFVALDAPSTAQNIETATVNIQLNKWKEVKFELTDKELAYTQEQIVREHIRPAARAIANQIDTDLCALALDIPWYHNVASNTAAAVKDLTTVRQILFDNKVPLMDDMCHVMVDGAMENELLQLEAFSQYQGAGAAGAQTQMTGYLGRKFGMEHFANQNVQAFTAGSIADGSSNAAIVGGGSPVAKGTTSITVDATSLVGDVHVGDIVEFDGIDQKYVVLSAATAATNAITFTIGVPGRGPGLLSAIPDNTGVTFVQRSAVGLGIGFHRHAFALAMAPLSELGHGRGAEIATITDPFTGLALRSRMYYDGDNSKVKVAIDVLYGVRTLDANMAVRLVNVD